MLEKVDELKKRSEDIKREAVGGGGWGDSAFLRTRVHCACAEMPPTC